MLKFVKVLSLDNRGVSALEYAILAAVILGIVVLGVETLGGGITSLFENAGSSLERAGSATTPTTP
jgi:Flp pilus assembly pilin Flp